jgi:hypothetical protein
VSPIDISSNGDAHAGCGTFLVPKDEIPSEKYFNSSSCFFSQDTNVDIPVNHSVQEIWMEDQYPTFSHNQRFMSAQSPYQIDKAIIVLQDQNHFSLPSFNRQHLLHDKPIDR